MAKMWKHKGKVRVKYKGRILEKVGKGSSNKYRVVR